MGKPILDDFIILKVLGKGVMGKVLLVRHRWSNRLYALKSVHKEWILSHGQIKNAQSERAILAAFRDSFNFFSGSSGKHLEKFLIKLHASFQTSTEIFYVLDFQVGGDLAALMSKDSRLGEQVTRFIAAEIAVGVGLLHEYGIVYRDLKPENVLIDSVGHIVLTDFGLSKILEPTLVQNSGSAGKTTTFCGTAEYLAPEILRGEPYDKSVDWWSFGTMLYEMFTGIPPYWSDSPSEMYKKILFEPEIDFPSNMNNHARDLITKLLSRTSTDRPQYEDIKRHPFFSCLNWHNIEERSVTSPINLAHSDEEDTSAFDVEFTRMPAAITPVDQETIFILSKPESQEPFSGFSYYPELDLDK